jgi:hypothetical protein
MSDVWFMSVAANVNAEPPVTVNATPLWLAAFTLQVPDAVCAPLIVYEQLDAPASPMPLSVMLPVPVQYAVIADAHVIASDVLPVCTTQLDAPRLYVTCVSPLHAW